MTCPGCTHLPHSHNPELDKWLGNGCVATLAKPGEKYAARNEPNEMNLKLLINCYQHNLPSALKREKERLGSCVHGKVNASSQTDSKVWLWAWSQRWVFKMSESKKFENQICDFLTVWWQVNHLKHSDSQTEAITLTLSTGYHRLLARK